MTFFLWQDEIYNSKFPSKLKFDFKEIKLSNVWANNESSWAILYLSSKYP